MITMMLPQNPNPQLLLSPPKRKPYFIDFLSLSKKEEEEEEKEEEEKSSPSLELTLAGSTSTATAQCPDEDKEYSLDLSLRPPSPSKKRKAVDQNPTPFIPNDPKRQEILPLNYVRETIEEGDEEQWKIKKRLTTSDLGNLCRLLVPKKLAEDYILSYWDKEVVENWVKSSKGVRVVVLDCDTNSYHRWMFKYLGSSKSYVFNENWNKFVKERNLKLKDRIGLYWDAQQSMFMFSVLDRANTDQ